MPSLPRRRRFPLIIHVSDYPSHQRDVAFARQALSHHRIQLDVLFVVPWVEGELDHNLRDLLVSIPDGGVHHVYYFDEIAPVESIEADSLSGLKWSYLGRSTMAVVKGAPSATLAHEIGHFLGLGHTDDPTHIMFGTGARSRSPAFSAAQGAKMRLSPRLRN